MRIRNLGTLLSVIAIISSSFLLASVAPSNADEVWNVSPLTVDFGTTTWEPGNTPPPHMLFTVTNTDPKKYLLVDIQQRTDSRTTYINFERNPSNSTTNCATMIYPSSSSL